MTTIHLKGSQRILATSEPPDRNTQRPVRKRGREQSIAQKAEENAAKSSNTARNGSIPASGSKCFRISSVPRSWSKNNLEAILQIIDPFLKNQNHRLSLHPACCGGWYECKAD